MGFEGDVRGSGLKLSSAAGRAVGQASKLFPGPLAADACTAALAAEARPGTGVATLRAVSQFFLMGFEGDVRGSGLKPSSAAGRAVGQASKPFPGPLAADACTAALAAEAGPGVATLRAVSQFFLMGFEGDVRGSGLKPSSAAGRAVGQASKPFPGPLAADACTAALGAEARPGTGVATLRAVSQFFLMGFEGDVRGSGLKPSSAAGRAVGQASKPFPGPLAADACTAALAAEAGPGVATLRAVSQFFLMGFEGDVRGSGLKPSSAAGRAVGQASKPISGTFGCPWLPKPGRAWPRCQILLGSRQGRWPGSKALPGTFGCRCLRRSLGCRSRAWRGHVESCLPVLSYGFRR